MLTLQSLFFWLFILDFAAAETQTADDIQRLITEHNGDSQALSTISAASWVDSPKVRGTVDILLTCSVTLFACVWSVLHLNIPVSRGRYAGFFDKLRWTVMAILFPDTVLVIATQQMLSARKLRNELKALQSRKNKSNPIEIPLDFCFFVEMGGFQVDLGRESISFGPSFIATGPERLPISADGFLKLIDRELLDLKTMMERANVSEKSKANVFQKVLIATQVLWMFMQCTARKVQGLPIILLEIHTMVHAVCALVVLLCWTSKPLDIKTPELLGSESDDILGLISLAIQSQVCPKHKFGLAHPHDNHENTAAIPQRPNQNDLEGQREAFHSRHLQRYETLPFGLRYDQGPSLHLQRTDIHRLQQATQYLRDHCEVELQPHDQALPRSEFDSFFSAGGNYALAITERYGNSESWIVTFFIFIGPWFYGPEELNHRVWVLILFVTLIYSGLHLSAWSGTFPTQAEEICWKTASIIPAGHAVYVTFFSCLAALQAHRSIPYFDAYISMFMLCIFAIVGVLNGIARLYLTVESFASLRNLPIGAFSMPVWLQLFPHL